jgi:hypothetical protein
MQQKGIKEACRNGAKMRLAKTYEAQTQYGH